MPLPEAMSPETQPGGSGAPASSPVALKACRLPLPTRIAFIGNYLPRECGIATFTTDLCTALAGEYGEGRLFAIPVNDPDSSYDYPEQVRLELTQEDLTSYERAADFLNFNGNDLVCLQHEYGIYGGAAGRYILALLRKLNMPLVTTLHTVLREPDTNQRIVLEEIAQAGKVLLSVPQIAGSFACVGLGLGKVRGLNHSQRHAFGNRLIKIHEKLPHDAGVGCEHSHRGILIPHQPSGQGNERRLFSLNRFDRQRSQLWRVGKHGHRISFDFSFGHLCHLLACVAAA